MVRAWTSVALLAGTALYLVLAGGASATSSLNLYWKGTGGQTTLGSTSAVPPPFVTAEVVLQGDAAGVSGVFVTFVFDYIEADPVNDPGLYTADGNELDGRNPAAVELDGPVAQVGPGNQFQPVSAGVTLVESTGSVRGEIRSFDSTVGLAAGCINCTVTLGTVLFSTTGNTSNDTRPDVIAAVLPNGHDAIVDASGAITTDITFGSINVLPEPTSAALAATALAAVGLLGRRRG